MLKYFSFRGRKIVEKIVHYSNFNEATLKSGFKENFSGAVFQKG